MEQNFTKHILVNLDDYSMNIENSLLSTISTFRELINKYGDENGLMDGYKEGLAFAPDPKRYIERRINIFEETLGGFISTITANDIHGISKSFDLAGFKRMGFEWVNNGYNATKHDIETFIYRNYDLNVLNPTGEDIKNIRFGITRMIAQGGALAFHISFLKNELNNGAALHLNQKKPHINIIDPLTFIDPAIVGIFLRIENEITSNDSKWNDSNIRLAAFCELLYEKKYFTEKPDGKKARPVKFMNDFAKSRYEIDIGGSLKKGKEAERDHHKKRIIKGKPPLNRYFK